MAQCKYQHDYYYFFIGSNESISSDSAVGKSNSAVLKEKEILFERISVKNVLNLFNLSF